MYSIFGIYCLPTIRIFTKTLTFKDNMEYKEDENFHYLVIKSCQGEYYGFNLNIKKERSYATKIVSPDERDDFMVANEFVMLIAGLILSAKRTTLKINRGLTMKMGKRRMKR